MILVRTEEGLFSPDGEYVLRTHEENDDCLTHGCAIHAPSNTVQNREQWPLNWRTDRGILERICSHGIGHPDLDSARHFERIGHEYENVHGCDGCCMKEKTT